MQLLTSSRLVCLRRRTALDLKSPASRTPQRLERQAVHVCASPSTSDVSVPTPPHANLETAMQTHMLQAVLDQLKTQNNQMKKIQKQIGRLEHRINDLFEYTSFPIISGQFGSEFADSVEFATASHVVDYFIQLAYSRDLGTLKQRAHLINTLEDHVLKERQGLKAAMKILLNEACENGSCSMMSLPRDFAAESWDDIRARLDELATGLPQDQASQERINNLYRLVDALSTGLPPKPLPGFMEMASALCSGRCYSEVQLDCKGRIDLRDSFIEFHIGEFMFTNSGLPETCSHMKQLAALLCWAYKVLEPEVYSGRQRDVGAVGYCFSVGKSAPHEPMKLYDDIAFDVAPAKRTEADIAYRYFNVKPTGLQERYARE